MNLHGFLDYCVFVCFFLFVLSIYRLKGTNKDLHETSFFPACISVSSFWVHADLFDHDNGERRRSSYSALSAGVLAWFERNQNWCEATRRPQVGLYVRVSTSRSVRPCVCARLVAAAFARRRLRDGADGQSHLTLVRPNSMLRKSAGNVLATLLACSSVRIRRCINVVNTMHHIFIPLSFCSLSILSVFRAAQND